MRILATVLFAFGVCHNNIFAGEDSKTETVKTNLEIMQNLAQTISKQIVSKTNISNSDKIIVDVKDDENGIAQQAFTSSLKGMGNFVFIKSDSLPNNWITLKFPTVQFRVQYTDMFRSGFMGNKKLKRTISASVTCQAIKNTTGEILYSNSVSEHVSDTVSVDDISTIEYPLMKSTHAELPDEPFIDRIVEPFVIIGASGIMVYLFFHVRS